MKSLRWGVAVCAVAVLTGALNTACSRHFVIVPQPEDGYAPTDTLYGWLNGDEIRVTFWFDTIMRVDTVVDVDTLWEKGSRTVLRIDTLTVHDTILRVDTVRVATTARVDTVVRVDTVRVPMRRTVVDTVIRVDTVRVPTTRTVVDTVLRVDTVRVSTTRTVVDTVVRIDTVRVPVTQTVVRTDTVRIAVTDTVRIVTTDTVRVAGQRMLFVPPGHYPPAGQCRVWIHDLAPGRQAAAAPCTGLGTVPAGAFILFGGEAWDFDYDWLGEAAARPGTVPPEIIALKRKG